MKSQLCERCDVILCEQDMKNGNAGGASNSSHPKHDSNRKSTLHAFRKFTAAKENVFSPPHVGWFDVVDSPKIILFHAWFHHKIILAKPRPWAEFSCAGACGAWKFPTSACRRLPAAAWDYSRRM